MYNIDTWCVRALVKEKTDDFFITLFLIITLFYHYIHCCLLLVFHDCIVLSPYHYHNSVSLTTIILIIHTKLKYLHIKQQSLEWDVTMGRLKNHRNTNSPEKINTLIIVACRGINPGDWGSWLSMILGWGIVGSPWKIIISYNVQEYEMKTLSKVVSIQK